MDEMTDGRGAEEADTERRRPHLFWFIKKEFDDFDSRKSALADNIGSLSNGGGGGGSNPALG